MKEWVVEAKAMDAREWHRWHMRNTNEKMNPETIEHCVERIGWLVRDREKASRVYDYSTVTVRMRNIFTEETIPAELFVL